MIDKYDEKPKRFISYGICGECGLKTRLRPNGLCYKDAWIVSEEAIEALKLEIHELKTKNENLRETMVSSEKIAEEQCQRYVAENAKLRAGLAFINKSVGRNYMELAEGNGLDLKDTVDKYEELVVKPLSTPSKPLKVIRRMQEALLPLSKFMTTERPGEYFIDATGAKIEWHDTERAREALHSAKEMFGEA